MTPMTTRTTETFDTRRNGDWMAGLPGWAKAAFLLGVPSVIALFLVWVNAQTLPTLARELNEVHTAVVTVKSETLTNRAALLQHAQSNELQADAMLKLLRILCTNTAPDEATRRECLRQ